MQKETKHWAVPEFFGAGIFGGASRSCDAMHYWHVSLWARFKILALKLSLNKVLLLVLLVTAIKIFLLLFHIGISQRVPIVIF